MIDPTLVSGDPSQTADIWDPATAGLATATGGGDTDTNFRTQVLQALLSEGIDITRVAQDQLDTMISTLWASPRIQDEFNLSELGDPSQFGMDFSDVAVSAAKLDSLIRKELFDPKGSDSSPLLQMGISLRELQGLPLTTEQQNYSGSAGGRVPAPFAGMYPITEDHDEGDPGIDYGTPVGTAIYSPFAGTIRLEDSGKTNWGKRAMVQLDNGYTFGVGHLTQFGVTDGQRIDPGELLGLSGGDVNDPSSGITTGPHVELQWIDPNGAFLDPHTILDPIFRGSSFRSLNMTSAAGISPSDASAILSKYPEAASMFRKYYGRTPTAQEILPLIGMNPQQLTQYFRNRPSQVAGLNFGAYDDLRSTADSAAKEMFGHGVTDGMLSEMHAQGKTDPASVKFYLTQMDIAGKMPKDTYQAIYNANVPHMQGVYNQGANFDPRIAQQQRQRAHDLGMTDQAIAAFHSYRAGERDPLFSDAGGGGGGDEMFEP